MKIPNFVPEDLRQLLRFVPTRGWDAVEWTPLLGTLRKVSWQFVTGSGVRDLAERVDALVPEVDVVRRPPEGGEPFDAIGAIKRRKQAGDGLLRLYFAQWLSEEGLFLDLRAPRLAFHDSRLKFVPNGLWIRLRPSFREGMVALYRSFYSDDASAFDAALRQMGMLHEDLSAEAESELKALLHAHFGVDQRSQTFSIDAFKASFDALFEFFIAHDYKMHSDFVFVGFYLITLYLSLERGGQAHNVRRICSDVLL